MGFPLGGLLAIVAVVGLGTSGTQTLIYGFVANSYRTSVRAAGVAWCAGFGRLGEPFGAQHLRGSTRDPLVEQLGERLADLRGVAAGADPAQDFISGENLLSHAAINRWS